MCSPRSSLTKARGVAWVSAGAPRMAGGDTSASRDALARAVAAAKAAARPRVASVFAKSSDPRYAPRPEANYGERWEAREALATVAGAGPAAARLGLEHPEHDTCEGAAHDETRTRDATTAGRPDDPRVAPSGTTPTWVETVDGDSGVYYFNPETRETSWDAPTDARLLKHRTHTRSNASPKHETRASSENFARENVKATPSENTSHGNERWWYLDDAGAWRGPYSTERLRFWRDSLPALLQVVDRDPNDPCVDRESARSAFDEVRATTLARVLGDDATMRRAAALGIAAHPRATAAQVERAVAALVSSRDINHDDDVSDPHPHDPHDPHDPHGDFPSRPYLLTENAAVRHAMASLPSAHADAILRGGFDPTEAARAVANAAFRAGTEPAQSATLNRVTGRLSVRSNSATELGDRGGAEQHTGTSPRNHARKGSRAKAGPRPGPAEVAAFKERKRRKRDAWLDT